MSEGRSCRGRHPAGPGSVEPIPAQPKGVSTNTLLAESTQSREEAAYAEIFRRHYVRVYQILYRLVGDEADDLAQEVFLRLYRQRTSVGDADVGAWLYRVATRMGYNALRANKRWTRYRDALGYEPESDGWQGNVPDPETWTQQRETQRLVQATLARLGRRQAAILTLRSSGLSYRELAAALGVSTGSVGTLLARAERAFERTYRGLLGNRAETEGES